MTIFLNKIQEIRVYEQKKRKKHEQKLRKQNSNLAFYYPSKISFNCKKIEVIKLSNLNLKSSNTFISLLESMICRGLPFLQTMKLKMFQLPVNLLQNVNNVAFKSQINKCVKAKIGNTWVSSSMMIGSKVTFSFSSFTSPNSLRPEDEQSCAVEGKQLKTEFQSLIRKIQEVAEIRRQRIEKCIQSRVETELQSYLKNLRRSELTEEGQINLLINEKLKIQTEFSKNEEFIRTIEFNENYRAMIMIRLAVLWNQNYQKMTVNQLIQLINKLEECKEMKNNDLKSMTAIFLTVETLRKCILSPRISKNMVCSTKSLSQNISYVMKCFKGEMEARQNLQKVENLLSYLLNVIEKNSNRYCFMNVQAQLQYLIAEIFKSFHQPEIYDDKPQCLLSNPPRVIFDEPFHQEYDRFLEMAVLILFDKRLKKQVKLNKLQSITEIFEQIKIYEEGKLRQSYEKDNRSIFQIKKLKGKVNKMNKRVGIIQWIQNFVGKSFPQ